MESKAISPDRIIWTWIIFGTIFIVILCVFQANTIYDSAQAPLTTIFTLFPILLIGVIIISCVTFIIYYLQCKKLIFTNSLYIIVSFLLLIFFGFFDRFEKNYSSRNLTDIVGGDTITSQTEYYSIENNQIRSISFMKNHKKDSTWITYDSMGTVIKKEVFKDGILLKHN